MAEHQKKSISFTIESILGGTERSRPSESLNPHVGEIFSSTDRKGKSSSNTCENRSQSLPRNEEEQFKLSSDSGRIMLSKSQNTTFLFTDHKMSFKHNTESTNFPFYCRS